MAQQNINVKSATTEPTAASALKKAIQHVLDQADYNLACEQETNHHYGDTFRFTTLSVVDIENRCFTIAAFE